MSRFYRIEVSPETATPAGASGPSNNAGAVWTNRVNGRADLGAQTIELDINVAAYDAPIGNAFVRIWGPSKEQISQASDFNGANIKVFAGMQPGLPLAQAAADGGQAGLLLEGQIWQAFGNWQGINQTLDFVVVTDGGATQTDPANISLNWKQGDKLSLAIRSVLSAAYPQYKIDMDISDNLVLAQDEHGVYQTIQQFAQYVKGVSLDILGQNNAPYSGVSIVLNNGKFIVRDNTAAPVGKPTPITVQDLIGQPTWLDAFTVSFTTVLRADLSVMDVITFPPIASATALTTPNSGSNVRNKNAFTGDWTITYVRHIGNSRSPDAQSWVTTFQAISNEAPGDLTTVGNTRA